MRNRRQVFFIVFMFFTFFTLSACTGGGAGGGPGNSNPAALPEKGEEVALMKTSMGDIWIRFFPQYAPKAVENFLTHAKNGYYNGLIFHRVVQDFMLQGGDPTATGTGGESIWQAPFEDEFSEKLHHYRGAVSMANSGPDTNGSQFFIVQGTTIPAEQLMAMKKPDTVLYTDVSGKPYTFGELYYPNAYGVYEPLFSKEAVAAYDAYGGTPHLDYSHTVFGQVYDGLDIVEMITSVPTQNDRPLEDVVIHTIEILPYGG